MHLNPNPRNLLQAFMLLPGLHVPTQLLAAGLNGLHGSKKSVTGRLELEKKSLPLINLIAIEEVTP